MPDAKIIFIIFDLRLGDKILRWQDQYNGDR